MATTAMIGIGATLSIENGSATLTQVGEVIEIGLPNPQTEDVEATHFGSPNRQREFIPGLIDNGEAMFRINWVPGNAADTLISQAQTAGVARDIEVEIPSGVATKQKFAFKGIVKGFEKDVPLDDRMTATVTIRVAGAVTQTAVSE